MAAKKKKKAKTKKKAKARKRACRRCPSLEGTIDSMNRENRILQLQVEDFKKLGMNEAKRTKLRRLEHFYSRFVNTMGLVGKLPNEKVLARLIDMENEDLSHIEAP